MNDVDDLGPLPTCLVCWSPTVGEHIPGCRYARELARLLRTLGTRMEQVFGDNCEAEMRDAYEKHGVMPNQLLPIEKARLQAHVIKMKPRDFVDCPKCGGFAARVEKLGMVLIFCKCVKEPE